MFRQIPQVYGELHFQKFMVQTHIFFIENLELDMITFAIILLILNGLYDMKIIYEYI